MIGVKEEKVKLEKEEKEREKRQERKQEKGQVGSKWENHATAEMGIRYGEITRQCKAGTGRGWEEQGNYSPVYYIL